MLYIATSAVLVGIVPYASLDNPAPIAMAVNHIGLPWFAVLVKIGAIAGPLQRHAGAALRPDADLLHHVARRSAALVAGRGPQAVQDPWINTIIVGVAACVAAGFCSLDALSDVTNVGSLAAFTLVCVTVIYLRFSSPGLNGRSGRRSSR